MNLNGIAGALNPLRLPQEPAGSRVDGQRTPHTPTSLPSATKPGTVAPARDPLAAAGAPATLPAEPPPGTDPELWSVLSADERVFFAKMGAMGPLTYGRMMAASPIETPMLRGARLDVKG
jgi:hypothetical protein